MEKLNTLESLLPGSGQYSFKKDLRLSLWIMAAAISYGCGDVYLKEYPDLNPYWRVAVALFPLLPLALYIRAWRLFFRQMDELQRRIQLEVWLFAALSTLVVNAVAAVLKNNELTSFQGFGVGGSYLIFFGLWLIASYVANRRFR